MSTTSTPTPYTFPNHPSTQRPPVSGGAKVRRDSRQPDYSGSKGREYRSSGINRHITKGEATVRNCNLAPECTLVPSHLLAGGRFAPHTVCISLESNKLTHSHHCRRP